MPKKISKSQKIGKRGLDILNGKLIIQDHKVEFVFVEIPQQNDFGIDGFLNIFDENNFQNITPFAQIKATNTPKKLKRGVNETFHKIDISNADYLQLKNKEELCILFAINTTNSVVKYNFPQFEDIPKGKYIENFPYELNNTEDSKILLFQNIQRFNELKNKHIQQLQNSMNLRQGKNIPLSNGFEILPLQNGYGLINKENKSFGLSGKLKITDPREKEQFKKDYNMLINSQKDYLILKKDWVINFEQINGWMQGDTSNSIAGDLIFHIPLIFQEDLLLIRGKEMFIFNCMLYFSLENQCYILKTGYFKEDSDFWFELRLSEKLKFSYCLNRDKIRDPEKLYSIYKFLQSDSDSLKFFRKSGYGFNIHDLDAIKSTKFINLEAFGDYELVRQFAFFKSFFRKSFEENSIEILTPENYSDKDIQSILSLSNVAESLIFPIQFNNNEQYKETKNSIKAHMTNINYGVKFQNKIFTLIASGHGEFVEFNDNQLLAFFKVEKLTSYDLVIADAVD